jgi:transposase
MLRPSGTLPVYLYAGVADMRKSIDGLSVLVEQGMALSPFSTAVFVFANRRRDKVKLLLWERNGFVLWYKRLEKQRFCWPRDTGDAVSVQLSLAELNYLLDGLDIFNNQPHKTLNYRSVC